MSFAYGRNFGGLSREHSAGYNSRVSLGYKEKSSVVEKRMLRVSFEGIRNADPLNLEKRFKNARDENFLRSFYTTFSMIPIGLVLGLLFYSLWFIAPKTQNLRIYQQDIFQWNQDEVAEKMEKLEFKFEIVPSVSTQHQIPLTFVDKPMAFEKDEIRLRQKFYYKQAYFYKSQALANQNISDVIWVEDSINSILESAAVETQTEKEDVYQSQLYCLNIYFKQKDQNKPYELLHSKDAGPEDDAIEVPIKPQVKNQKTKDEEKNPFRKPTQVESEPEPTSRMEPCLVQFGIWRETVSLIDQMTPLQEEFNQMQDDILGYDSKKDCEQGGDYNGIFYKGTCHYYEVLQRLCIKIRFNNDENSPQKLYFDNGCFADAQSTLFKNAEVGRYYDFGSEVSMEVRNSEDPYMVFAYTRDNLGTDFTLFLGLAFLCFFGATVCFFIVSYYYCCVLEKGSIDPLKTSVPASFDSDMEFRQYRQRQLM